MTERLLDVIEFDIVPLTRAGVLNGNKVFGAALLRKDDLSLVLAETNNEVENPLWHGEMHLLKKFYELPERPASKDLIFLSTHEPCSLCLSAITWAGFDNFSYFFTYEDSRDAFAIPHDLNILAEVFDGGYHHENAFWRATPLKKTADPARVQRIHAIYEELSATYQCSKTGNSIPLR